MAVTATASNRAKYALARKMIDLSADSIRAILMRQGFVFNKDDHATRLNLKGYLAGTTISINSSLQILDSGNGFLTAGLVPGNKITMSGWTNGGNNATKVISTVTTGIITVTDTTGLVQESAGNMVTIQADDELLTGNGYSRKRNPPHRTDGDRGRHQRPGGDELQQHRLLGFGGIRGTEPGVVFYDDSVTEKTIIGYLNFDGDQTIADGNKLRLQNARIRIS